MQRYSKRIMLSASLVAPPALSLAAFLICLGAVLIPPSYYSSLMMEQDLMFLNMDVLGFFAAYWAAFMLGYVLGSQIGSGQRPADTGTLKLTSTGVMSVMFLLFLEVLIFAYSFDVLYHRVPEVFINFITNNVERTKEALMVYGTHDAFQSIVPISNGTFWWVVFRWQSLTASLSRFQRRFVFYPVLAAFIFVILAYSFLLGARYQIVPLLFGLMVIFYIKFSLPGRSMKGKDRVVLLLFPAAIIAVFAFFSILRGAAGNTGVLYTLVGYGPASYNRLAAILNGSLDYNGQYGVLNEFGFLFHFPLEYRLIPVEQIFNLPNINEIQIYSKHIADSHLMPGFTWSSIFGQLYADLGMLSFAYMLVYGIAAARLWSLISRRKVFGILLYPYMAFSIMLWVGYGVFAFEDLSSYIFIAAILALIENLFAQKTAAQRFKQPRITDAISPASSGLK